MLNDIAQYFLDEYLIYLRKSRSDNPGETVEEVLSRHEKQLQEFAEKKLGFRIKEENIYREVVSGETIDDRPELLKMLDRIEKGNIKGVLVIEPQRLSRGDLLDCGRIIQFFKYTNTSVMTPMKSYFLEDKYDRKFFEMELLRGNDYLEYTKEILYRGRVASVKEGKFVGSTPPFGYDKEKLKKEKGYKLVRKDNEAEIVEMMFEMASEFVGTSNIANHLNKLKIKPKKIDFWTPHTVRVILTNPVYYGVITWDKRKTIQNLKDGKIVKSRPKNEDFILVKGIHDPIISKEKFDIVQSILKSGSSPRVIKDKEIKNPLAGLVECSECGHSMIRRAYQKAKVKKYRRVYEFDKESLSSLIRHHKQQSGLSVVKIAETLEVSPHVVKCWFNPKVEKAVYAKIFSDKWFQLKTLLNIQTDEFDKALMTYESPKPPKENLVCSISHCKNVSSNLEVVENGILRRLEEYLNEYKYFIDNYEEEVLKVAKNNAKTLSRITKDIESLKKELRTARRNYNKEEYSKEEYFEIKKEIEEELEDLEQTKKEIEEDEEENKIIKYKKAVPVLANCIKKYPVLSVAEKNELLKSIISKVIYKKEQGGRWNKQANESIDLKVYLKI